MSELVEVGQLWVAVESFFSSGESNRKGKRRCKIEILLGEVIEVRYPYVWQMRTRGDNEYFHISETDLLEKCIHYADIDKEARFNNKHTLSAILEQNLFKKVDREPAMFKLINSIIKLEPPK